MHLTILLKTKLHKNDFGLTVIVTLHRSISPSAVTFELSATPSCIVTFEQVYFPGRVLSHLNKVFLHHVLE